MKYLTLVLVLFLSSCFNIDDDCFMGRGTFSNFNIINEVPNFSIANGDSVVIDMSNYWTADVGCDRFIYIPEVISAKSESDLYELRSVGKFLIVKGIKNGSSTISVNAEQKFDNDECIASGISQSIEFKVTVGDITSRIFEENVIENVENRITEVKTEPETFSIGDTVLVYVITKNIPVRSENIRMPYNFKWIFDYSNPLSSDYINILTTEIESSFYCTIGHDLVRRNSISYKVTDTLKTIKGFVHIEDGNDNILRNGIAFTLNSK